MAVVIERSPEMIRLVYFLIEYARVTPDGRCVPPAELGDMTWRKAYEQFFTRLGGGRSFKTFYGSADGLRKGNIRDHKEAGIAFRPRCEAALRTWEILSREQRWTDLQQYRDV
jgi:hypothetical protein